MSLKLAAWFGCEAGQPKFAQMEAEGGVDLVTQLSKDLGHIEIVADQGLRHIDDRLVAGVDGLDLVENRRRHHLDMIRSDGEEVVRAPHADAVALVDVDLAAVREGEFRTVGTEQHDQHFDPALRRPLKPRAVLAQDVRGRFDH